MKQLIFIFLLGISIVSCNQSKNELKNIQSVKKHFSEEEIKDLSEIVSYFDERIRFEKTIKKPYNDFFQHLSKAETNHEITRIVEDYLPENQEIFNKISKDVFNKIWKSKNVYNPATNDSIKILSLNYGGDYYQFLGDFSKSGNPILSEYFESFEIAGDLSPTMVALLQKKWDQLDLKNEGVRLIIAIHYVTIAESKVVMRNGGINQKSNFMKS
jgi:hypothetical protein